MLIFLRRLVTVLTGAMIVGLLVIIALFVIKFSGGFPGNGGPDLPKTITLPGGTEATAFTQGPGWYAIITSDDRILIYDRDTGQIRQSVKINLNSGE